MTEAEWLTCTDPTPMLDWLQTVSSQRKLQLLAVASCRRLMDPFDNEWSRNAVEFGEWAADEKATDMEVAEAFELAWCAWNEASKGGSTRELLYMAAHGCAAPPKYDRGPWITDMLFAPYTPQGRPSAADQADWCSLVRCIFGNPFRSILFNPSWRTNTALAIANQCYSSRDFGAAPILADALQDSGCEDAGILSHLRGGNVHVRGCYVVDAILGKE